MGVSEETIFRILKENYDGYHFSKKCAGIYNPFSLLNALDSQEIKDFRFQSGAPKYLIEVLKRDNFYLPQLDCLETSQSDLSSIESYMQNPVALLYETGYITIKDFDGDTMSYTLGLPNKEVAVGFAKALVPIYSGWEEEACRQLSLTMRKALTGGDPETFMRTLQTFLKAIPTETRSFLNVRPISKTISASF